MTGPAIRQERVALVDLLDRVLGGGVVIIGGVVLYNWVQERSYRRRLEQAFAAAPPDVLLDRAPGSQPDDERVEPRLQRPSGGARVSIELPIDARERVDGGNGDLKPSRTLT